MPTTTNYGWTTPADTDLVKDGAAAIRTLGSSVDTTTKALNPSTTLGDIEYRSSTANTNTRLGIGSTGQVLTVSGGVPAWGSAPAAGANWSLLNAGGTALTGATTITVSGISGQDKIMVLIQNVSTTSSNYPIIAVRFNTDTGANYKFHGIENDIQSTYNNNNFYAESYTANTYIPIGRNGSNDSGQFMSGYCLVTGCNAAGVKVYNSAGSGGRYGSGAAQWVGAGFYNSSSTISSVSLFSTQGNFDAGTLFIYASA